MRSSDQPLLCDQRRPASKSWADSPSGGYGTLPKCRQRLRPRAVRENEKGLMGARNKTVLVSDSGRDIGRSERAESVGKPSLRIRAEQALLHRLSGSRNPLHSDPAFAASGGSSKPILRRLCACGTVAGALLRELPGRDARGFASISARFIQPVMPGEELTLRGSGICRLPRDETSPANRAVTRNDWSRVTSGQSVLANVRHHPAGRTAGPADACGLASRSGLPATEPAHGRCLSLAAVPARAGSLCSR
jgi:acyl dehydratase